MTFLLIQLSRDHPDHLRHIFLHCRHYNIRLNPHKCIFCIDSSRLLGFIVSKDEICLDPLKVEAIINLPSPSSLHQLHSLQGKANFLRCFIPNYAEVARGYTRLLKHGVPFCWDEIAQKYFEALKTLLFNAPLLRPPNYHLDFYLYLAVVFITIAMVLVQEDDDGNEHVIYYLSRKLLDPKVHYAHV